MTPEECAEIAETLLESLPTDVTLPSTVTAIANAWIGLGSLKAHLQEIDDAWDRYHRDRNGQ